MSTELQDARLLHPFPMHRLTTYAEAHALAGDLALEPEPAEPRYYGDSVGFGQQYARILHDKLREHLESLK